MTEKRCADCGVIKPAADFYKHRTAAGGLHTYCKPCACARSTAARQRRIDEVRAYDRQRYYADRERKLVALRNRYAEDAEFRARVIESVRERVAQLKDDPEWQATRKASVRKYDQSPRGRDAHVKSEGTRRARKLGTWVEHVDRQEVLIAHQGKCGICGDRVDPEDFHVDHIVPLARGGEHSYANTQPAHPVCNLKKGARVALKKG